MRIVSVKQNILHIEQLIVHLNIKFLNNKDRANEHKLNEQENHKHLTGNYKIMQ